MAVIRAVAAVARAAAVAQIAVVRAAEAAAAAAAAAVAAVVAAIKAGAVADRVVATKTVTVNLGIALLITGPGVRVVIAIMVAVGSSIRIAKEIVL
ncbi:MAG TPA: hypothetical protein VHE60_03410 [Pyrinomonadaceae bacterium]|nr:hypothetical protein [Pyrinomonadaceae bacterium]